MNTSTRGRGNRRSSGASGARTFSNKRPGGLRFSGGRVRGGGGGGKRGGGKKNPTFNPLQFINKNPADLVQEVYTPKHTFKSFGLSQKVLKTVSDMGITTPSPIQDQTIPVILEGKDIIGLAETGTGKTAAFLLPLIERTLSDPSHKTLILAPTRELAVQIAEELAKLARGFRMFSVVCVGGLNIRPQIQGLRRAHNFVIGTPGRVLDLINRGNFRPDTVKAVVLDEADRMLDMGFINDMKEILSSTPKDRHTLFFSATMSKDVENLVNDFLINPVRISVKKKDVTNSIEQDIVYHGHHNKFETLTNLLSTPEFTRVLVFGAMKHSVEKLSTQLSANGIKADSIHGNKSHVQRQRSLNNFKKGGVQVLVATDVAARGIHVDNVSHVINYDLPNTFEDYVHRIGRTGRADKRGKALTFVLGGKNK